MEVIHKIEEIQDKIKKLKLEGKKIGFVPTMGALHQGHLSLMEQAKEECDIVVASIFVNPLQFAPEEDLDKYPRTLEKDCELAESVGVDYIFAPTPHEMYPNGFDTTVCCGGITTRLEGASRPGHFDGVTTVVLKLFNITLPDCAYFGQKDAQQVLVIKKMVRDLNIPLTIITCPIVREDDGLALSSRNQYLTTNERSEVNNIYKGLLEGKKLFDNGEVSAKKIKECVENIYAQYSFFTIEYVSITDNECYEINDTVAKGMLLSVACRTTESDTRLIDNIVL